MANLSLARIMFGTNEDFHASHGLGAPAFLSLPAQPVLEHSAKASGGSEPATLSELIHKAWTNFTGKH